MSLSFSPSVEEKVCSGDSGTGEGREEFASYH